MFKTLYVAGLLLYGLFIYMLSDQPSLPGPMWFDNQDKLYHTGAYCILGALIWQSIKQWLDPSVATLALLSILLGSLYGATDEWHQSFVPGRSPSVADWLADTIGVSLAVFCLHKLRKHP